MMLRLRLHLIVVSGSTLTSTNLCTGKKPQGQRTYLSSCFPFKGIIIIKMKSR